MKLAKYIFIVCFTTILWGCSNPFDEQKVLFDEVMVIHDEVMPRMQDIYELKKQLSERMQALQQDTTGLDSAAYIQCIQQKIALEDADDAMMTWMRDFSDNMAPPSEEKYKSHLEKTGITHEEYLKFLDAEKTKISEVSDAMLSSISDAKELLK